MDGACDACGKQERFITGFWRGDLREMDHLEDLGISGKILLKWIFSGWDGEAWI